MRAREWLAPTLPPQSTEHRPTTPPYFVPHDPPTQKTSARKHTLTLTYTHTITTNTNATTNALTSLHRPAPSNPTPPTSGLRTHLTQENKTSQKYKAQTNAFLIDGALERVTKRLFAEPRATSNKLRRSGPFKRVENTPS